MTAYLRVVDVFLILTVVIDSCLLDDSTYITLSVLQNHRDEVKLVAASGPEGRSSEGMIENTKRHLRGTVLW